jgi:endonuclease YncB( thermonuclease family)
MEKPQIGLVLDQGFRTFTLPHRSLPSDAKPGDVFRSVKATSGYRLEPYNKVRRVWSYVATVIRVVDGDTVWVTLDTGFGDYVDQNLRLRGIDTPEMDTAKGRKAKDFVVNAIGNVKRIIVSTTKVDKYDRYLADILYVEEDVADVYEIAKKGTYLNRQLISDGLAERYVE